MKCENCGKNEVTFVSQTNFNGQMESHYLCSECARKLGYTQQFADSSLMQNFFGRNGLFADFFASPWMDHMNRMLENPFDDCFSVMPALAATPMQEANRRTEPEDLVGQEDQKHFSYLRQHNALKMELKKAVHQENFERAAQLRDQIHQLEAEHKAQKEHHSI